jgi:hypothetical protein
MVASAAVIGAIPATAQAHGIQGRADLPVPLTAFYWAASIVLVVSFVGLAAGWKQPLLAGWLNRWHREVQPGRAALALLAAGRVASVGILVLVILTALFGSTTLNANFAPIWIFVVWWIGIALLSATIGDGWRALHPIAAIARWMNVEARTTYPVRYGMWPAFALLALFTWLELVYPTAANVRMLGVLVIAWAVMSFIAMLRWGIDPVLDNVEPFSAYTRVIGRLGVFGLRDDGSLERRPIVLGVLRQGPVAGLAAFTGLLIGSVSYDGLSRTLWWKQRVSEATVRLVERGIEARHAQLVFGTIGLVMMITLAVLAFVAAAWCARKVGSLPARSRFGTSAQAFAPSLVPIAFAYVVAHYFSFFWFQSQNIIRLASDPFGRGWDLLGTAGFEVSYETLSANAIWAVQVGAIVIGHVVALVLAHDRALEIEHDEAAARGVLSQWPMLALMVLYTIGGLYFLSEGLNV